MAALEVADLDAVAQARLIAQGEATATEPVTWAIDRIERLNPSPQCGAHPMYEQALAAAATTLRPGSARSASSAALSPRATPSWCGG